MWNPKHKQKPSLQMTDCWLPEGVVRGGRWENGEEGKQIQTLFPGMK